MGSTLCICMGSGLCMRRASGFSYNIKRSGSRQEGRASAQKTRMVGRRKYAQDA